jgi:phosphotransferase system enzyme I (PtsI)
VFPFVAGVADLDAALELFEDVKAELRREGVAFAADLPVGLVLEIPSAAWSADLLAPCVDFFSVGTNDLIQYLLAVDRVDPRVAGLYQPLHPAVLRTLQKIVEVAEREQLPVSVCGEMAAEPASALFLVGIGFRELSMSPSFIPRVKETLRGVKAEQARQVALSCLSLRTAAEVEERLRRELLEAARAAPVSEAERA